MITGMVIPLTPKEANERLERFGSAMRFRWADNRGHLFTCRHWDEQTRLCRVYERRPEMCRGYPYERPCEHGCDHRGKAVARIRGEARASWVELALQPA
jgi:Fe-S-cluster containining protein